jgi:hypothetical protein
MADSTTPATNVQRPLFFKEVLPFDTEKHRDLRLPATRPDFGFAAQANLLPITLAEVSQVLRHYPIVFIEDGTGLALVAVTGLKPGQNNFIDDQGQWRADTYIPSYVRGYPFIAIRPAENAEAILAFDPTAPEFKHQDGQALLDENGQLSDQLKGILAYQTEYRILAERTHAIGRALKEAGVLEEGQLQVQPIGADGQPAPAEQINGFLVVSEAKLRELPPDTLKKLSDLDALGLAYAHLFSLVSLPNLMGPKPEPAAANAKSKRSK